METDNGAVATKLDDLTELWQHPDGWIEIRQRNLSDETDVVMLSPETVRVLLELANVRAAQAAGGE